MHEDGFLGERLDLWRCPCWQWRNLLWNGRFVPHKYWRQILNQWPWSSLLLDYDATRLEARLFWGWGTPADGRVPKSYVLLRSSVHIEFLPSCSANGLWTWKTSSGDLSGSSTVYLNLLLWVWPLTMWNSRGSVYYSLISLYNYRRYKMR